VGADISAEMQPGCIDKQKKCAIVARVLIPVQVKPTVILDMSPAQHHYHPVLPPYVSSAFFLLAGIAPVAHNLFTYLKIVVVFITCTSDLSSNYDDNCRTGV
jgi:hypothetical protein